MRNSGQSKVAAAGASGPAKLYGDEVPRIFTPPLRKLTARTSAGFACIEFAEDVLGLGLYPWQKWFLIHALELLPDNSFRFRTVVLLVARQNGKSTLAQVLALFFMYVRAARLVIGTAQNLDIAEEVWAGAVEIAEECDELAAEIKKVNQTNGKKSLDLTTGERYKVQTASRRGGRGLSGDLILLDELREHQSWDAWGAITKTTMARALALILALSNAGDASSIVLRYLRKMAHASLGDPDGINSAGLGMPELTAELPADLEEVPADDDTLGIFEWSAVPGCSLDDRVGWAAANPSLGYAITERAISSARKTDPEWVFRTEVLCQWNDGTTEGPFAPGSWEAGLDPDSSIPPGAPVTFCVDTEHDRSRSFIAAAGRRANGRDVHAEIVAARYGTAWVVGWFAERATESNPVRVVIQARGAPASGMIPDLAELEHVTVIEWGGTDLGGACGKFYDAVKAHLWAPDPAENETDADRPARIFHLPQPVLDLAAGTAVTKPLGDAWVWNRKASPFGAAPLMAATGAAWDVLLPVETVAVSAYESGALMVV